jgi:hypothetical protein
MWASSDADNSPSMWCGAPHLPTSWKWNVCHFSYGFPLTPAPLLCHVFVSRLHETKDLTWISRAFPWTPRLVTTVQALGDSMHETQFPRLRPCLPSQLFLPLSMCLSLWRQKNCVFLRVHCVSYTVLIGNTFQYKQSRYSPGVAQRVPGI